MAQVTLKQAEDGTGHERLEPAQARTDDSQLRGRIAVYRLSLRQEREGRKSLVFARTVLQHLVHNQLVTTPSPPSVYSDLPLPCGIPTALVPGSL